MAVFAGAAAPAAPALAAGLVALRCASVGGFSTCLPPLLWLWGEVFPRGVLLVSRGRSVATGATTQAPWWLALSRRAGCGGVLRVAGAWRVVCVARHTLPRGGEITSLLRYNTPHCQVKSCLVLPPPTTKNGARLSTIRSLAS